jgi:tetratricopeptide (TPR) repeat protein
MDGRPMSLSVCLITRNEEQNLPRVLASVAGLADEVIVTDTGSTDRTVAVAAELKARVSQVAWANDFAAARNVALEQATGDWVLWLNPDEDVPAISHPHVRDALVRSEVFAFGVIVQQLQRADGSVGFTENGQLRLFRRRPEVRFVGRLHPDFQTPLADLAQRESRAVLPAPILLRRHAYLSQMTEEKLRWALRLLELELRDRPGQLHYQIEYGRTLLLLNDPKGHDVLAQAVEQVLPQRDAPAAPSPVVQRLLEYLLTVTPAQSRGRLSRDEAGALAERWFPNNPPLLWRLAENAFQAGDFGRATGFLEKLVLCGRTGLYDRSDSFDPAIMGESAVLNLGACYTRLKRWDEAEECFRQLLPSKAYSERAAQNLRLVQELRLEAVRRSDLFWEKGAF